MAKQIDNFDEYLEMVISEIEKEENKDTLCMFQLRNAFEEIPYYSDLMIFSEITGNTKYIHKKELNELQIKQAIDRFCSSQKQIMASVDAVEDGSSVRTIRVASASNKMLIINNITQEFLAEIAQTLPVVISYEEVYDFPEQLRDNIIKRNSN